MQASVRSASGLKLITVSARPLVNLSPTRLRGRKNERPAALKNEGLLIGYAVIGQVVIGFSFACDWLRRDRTRFLD